MKKVSLRELVADKIIFSILIAMYYWMWARNDWKDYYTTVQNVIFAFSFYYLSSYILAWLLLFLFILLSLSSLLFFPQKSSVMA